MLLVCHCGWQTGFHYYGGLLCFPLLWGDCVHPPALFSLRLAVGSQSWQGSATWAALCPTVSAMNTVVIGPDLSRMVPSYHLTFTSQKGTPLLVHPMLATRVHRSGYLQDGAIVPSDLLISQKGTSLLVHPMLHPAIFGGLQCCYPYKIPSSVAKQWQVHKHFCQAKVKG